MGAVRQPPPDEGCSDEELMLQLAARQQEALKLLYGRYAPLVFHLASQTLDPAAAEDIVQDVFLAVWHKAGTFDPKRGAFRPWMLQIMHFRILNELRRRSRRPKLDPGSDGQILEDLPDDSAEPVEAAWHTYRREAVRAAIDKLPPSQRQALSLAFFQELTHDQVAAMLNLPLGTVKTRIRTALHTLRSHLAPLGIALFLAGLLSIVSVRYLQQQAVLQRGERILLMLTSSETAVIHLSAAPGVPPETHGSYRGRTGTALAVVALDKFPPAPTGQTYQGWVLHQGAWISLGTIRPDASGDGILIGESPELAAPPEAIQVTLEPVGGSTVPSGMVIIIWPNR